MPDRSLTLENILGVRILDLFCGAGGFSEGFRQAGCQIVAGVDLDREAIDTFSLNFPEASAVCANLDDPGPEIESALSALAGTIDVIVGGPPCQGFSVAGKRQMHDPRNALYKAYMHWVSVIGPSAVVIENVPTIASLYGGVVADTMIGDLQKLGYDVSVHTLNASHFGVPQARRRLFFVGIRGSGVFVPPTQTTALSPLTCWDAISDLPMLENDLGADEMLYQSAPLTDYQIAMRAGSRQLTNHWAVAHKDETKRIIAMVPDGGNYKALPEHLWQTRKVNIAWTRMDSRKPSFTIDAGHNHHFHYAANRVPTVRESARIQSFPDRFRFLGKKTSQFRQVGNAVPPLLAREVALQLREALECPMTLGIRSA